MQNPTREPFSGLSPLLWAKTLLVLLSGNFQIGRFLFLLVGFLFRALLGLELHPFGNANLGFCIRSLGINEKPELITERSTDKMAGILEIFP